MDIGVVLQTDPPASWVIERARQAEQAGFSHVWTYDSCVLWQEPFVIYANILSATSHIRVGPMVTNPATRDVSVTASIFATLNDMFGNRTVCGIGRGDSALRVIGLKPTSMQTFAEAITNIKELAEGRQADLERGARQAALGIRQPLAGMGGRVRPEGPAGHRREGGRPDPPGRRPRHRPLDHRRGPGGRPHGGPRPVRAHNLRGGAGLRGKRPRPPARAAAAGSGEWSATTSPTSWRATASRPRCRGLSRTTSRDRQGYDYSHHGKAGNPSVDFVPDYIVDRFCLLGPVEAHVARLAELADIGVDQFALYLMHDNIPETLEAYRTRIIPAAAGL